MVEASFDRRNSLMMPNFPTERGSTQTVLTTLILELHPNSVRYRRYLEAVAGRTLLEQCLSKVTESLKSASCSGFKTVVFDAEERDRISSVAKRYSNDVWVSQSSTDLGAICELTRETNCSHVAALSLEYVLAPTDLLGNTIAFHVCEDNDLTVVHGFPERVSPVVFKRSFVEQLEIMDLPEGYDRYLAIVDLLRKAAIIGDGSGSQFRAKIFDASRFYQYGEEGIARRVELEYPEDIGIADSMLLEARDKGTNQVDGLEILKSWNLASVRARNRRLQDPFGRATIPIDSEETISRRILYVSNGAAFSGAEESLCVMLRELPRSRFEKFALVSLEGHLTDRLRAAGVRVICPNRDFAESKIDNLTYLLGQCQEINPDLIHLNGLDGFPILAVSRFLRIPVVVHVRNNVVDEYLEYVTSAARIIAVSAFVKKAMISLGAPADRVEVIYDEFDPHWTRKGVISKEECRTLLHVPIGSKVVALIARIVSYKKHDVMLRAAAIVKQRIPHFHLLLVGEMVDKSKYGNHLRSLIDELDLRETVSWIHFVEDIRLVHSAADVLVLCSHGEALGRCVVEAMAMEVPVVVSDSGGTCEIVSHERTGLIIGDGDHAELANAIERLLTDKGLYESCAARAREFVIEHLTAERSAGRVARVYEEVLAETGIKRVRNGVKSFLTTVEP